MTLTAPKNKHELIREKLEEWLTGSDIGTRLLPERRLAGRFGVSRPTLRKAIDVLVKDKTLRRVHGDGVYVNRILPRSLKVCLAYKNDMDPVNYPFFNTVLQYLETEISNNGGTFLLTSVGNNGKVPSVFHEANSIIALSQIQPALLPKGIPVVVLFDPGYVLPDALYILIDDYMGGMIAAKYILSLKHSKIAFIGDVARYFWARERYRGICDAAQMGGVPKPKLILASSDPNDRRREVEEIRSGKITAVICVNDCMAMGFVSALHKSGLRVPEDISIIGFDDLGESSFFHPPLTTVRLPAREAAVTAIEELGIMRKGIEEGHSKRIVLPVELIKRESCARCCK